MTQAKLEHVNITVADPGKTAAMLIDLFGWEVRWQGPSSLGGSTIHVGSDTDYIAVYTSNTIAPTPFKKGVPLNHIGVVVDDLDAVEARVIDYGLKPYSHGNYEPGRRFYFFNPDGIEFEIISYQ